MRRVLRRQRGLYKVAYHAMTRYRNLSPADQRERLEVAADLLRLVQWWRGDMALSACQEDFLAQLALKLLETAGTCRVTPDEWATVRYLDTVMSAALEAGEPDDGC